MGAHQTMIWYLVTIRDALALITRAGTYNVRGHTHIHTHIHSQAHTLTQIRVTGIRVSSSLHKCLPAYNRPAHLRISYEYFISRFPGRMRHPVASSECAA